MEPNILVVIYKDIFKIYIYKSYLITQMIKGYSKWVGLGGNGACLKIYEILENIFQYFKQASMREATHK